MKISLIEPQAPALHIFSQFRMPRLGLPILATLLMERGHEVKVYCEDLHKLTIRNLWEIARSDLIGFSLLTPTSTRGYMLASLLRPARKPIVFGGVHPTWSPDETLKYGSYCIRGEGEETMMELVGALENGGDVDNILGLSFKKDGEIVHNPDRPLAPRIDHLPSPNLALIQGYRDISVMPVETSRGCPYDCSFCSVAPMFGRRYRPLNHDRVMEQIARYKDMRKSVFFYDDNFAASNTSAKKLLTRMIDENVRPSWACQVRTDVIRDEELLDMMKQANCGAACVGFESVNQKTLESFKKKQTVEDIRETVHQMHKRKIRVHGMFVLGSDDDDVQTVRDTIKFAKENAIDTVQFLILTPLPGTRMWDKYQSENRIFATDWSLFDGMHVTYTPKKMTPFELQKEVFKATKSFYSFRSMIKPFLKSQYVTAIMKFRAYRLVGKWTRANKGFLAQLKSMTHWLYSDRLKIRRKGHKFAALKGPLTKKASKSQTFSA